MRLTVVTIFGLIGTVATGFLGMNLIAEADKPLVDKILYFFIVMVPTTVLTLYTVAKAGRLSEFLEALANERASWRTKLGALVKVWR